MAVLLKDYIERLISAEQHNWQMQLARRWPDMVGDLCTKMCLEKIEGNVLKVGVYDSHWIHELFMLAPTIVRMLNNNLGGNYLSSVRFVLKEKKMVMVKKSDTVKASYKNIVLTAEQKTALQAITDAELRNLMKKFLIRCLQP